MYPCVKHIPVGIRYLQSENVDDWLQGGSHALKGSLLSWLVEFDVQMMVTISISDEWKSILFHCGTDLTSNKSIIQSSHSSLLSYVLRFLTLLDLLTSEPSSLYSWLLEILPLASDSDLIALSLVTVISRSSSLQSQVFVEIQKLIEKKFTLESLQILACLLDEGQVSVSRVKSVCDVVLKEV